MLLIVWGFVNVLLIIGLAYLFRLGIVNDRKRVKKQLSYYKLLLHWNLCDTENEKLGAYLLGCGYKKVMIYGAGDLGEILYHKIKTCVNVGAFIEKNPKTEQIEGIPVLSCKDAGLKMDDIDCIIVTPIFDFGSIQRELSDKDSEVAIVSLDTLIYGL